MSMHDYKVSQSAFGRRIANFVNALNNKHSILSLLKCLQMFASKHQVVEAIGNTIASLHESTTDNPTGRP